MPFTKASWTSTFFYHKKIAYKKLQHQKIPAWVFSFVSALSDVLFSPIFYSHFISFLPHIAQWIRNTHASHPNDSTGFMRFNSKVIEEKFSTQNKILIFCNNLLSHTALFFMCALALPFSHYKCTCVHTFCLYVLWSEACEAERKWMPFEK
jgi:hypothetical protein